MVVPLTPPSTPRLWLFHQHLPLLLSCQPGGSLFITTISKTNLSYALAIVAAERVLGIVPSGTHDWDKFITPEDLERLLESSRCPASSSSTSCFLPFVFLFPPTPLSLPFVIDGFFRVVSLPPSDGFSVESIQGMQYNPLSGRWSWTQSTSVNYALHAVKRREEPPPGHTQTGPAHTGGRDVAPSGHN